MSCCCVARCEQALDMNDPFCGALYYADILDLFRTSRMLSFMGEEIFITEICNIVRGFDGGSRKITAKSPISALVLSYSKDESKALPRGELVSELDKIAQTIEGRSSMILLNRSYERPLAIMDGLECHKRDEEHPFYFYGEWNGNFFAHRRVL